MRCMWLVLVLLGCGADKSKPAEHGSGSASVTATPLPEPVKPSTYARPAGPEKPPQDDPPPPEPEDDEDDVVAIAPPPPPPPPRKVPVDVVQPMKIDKQRVDPADDDEEEEGEEGGVVGGVVGGDIGGVAPPPPPPPPPPAPPQNVAPMILEGNRIAGDKAIAPDDATKKEIGKSGKDRIVGAFKLCITSTGSIQSIHTLKSTGFAAYDAKILREMRNWAYRPYMVNGKAVPVCTAVTFIYAQQP